MVTVSEIRDNSQLDTIEDRWGELARDCVEGGVLAGPDWLLPWWHAYQRVLEAEPLVLVARDGSEVVGIAPLYTRVSRLTAGVKVREVRLMGDAGPRPTALDLLVAHGSEDHVGSGFADHLASRGDWDVIDLEPMRDPSRVRAFFVNRFSANGTPIQSSGAGGARRIELTALGATPTVDETTLSRRRLYTDDPGALRKGLAALRRLSRLEWADREETSPLVDAEAFQLLEEATLRLGQSGFARLVRLDDAHDEAIASALIVDDGEAAVVLAMAVDPEHADQEPGPAARLLSAEAVDAAARGRRALDVVTGATEFPLPDLPSSRLHGIRLRAFGDSSSAALARTYGVVRRRVETARHAPGAAAAGARAAWSKIRTAAATVTGYLRLNLYRGELWTRGIIAPDGFTIEPFSLEDFEALGEAERVSLVENLDLNEGHCRAKWERGDTVVIASLAGTPAGIAWCARRLAPVPELDRTLRLGLHEAYIHDVFVAPHARGRSVAPSMLEHLAATLRERDVYRSWALIGADNAPSARAFEKAAYTPVADVIYARVAKRLRIRPPDPEARKLFGM